MNTENNSTHSRKEFIRNTGVAVAGITTMTAFPFINFDSYAIPKKEYTVQDIINMLIQPVDGAPFSQTVDTLKSGKAEQKVTGIVTTMFATVDVIKQTIKQGANFIIAHEPTFYNHTDDKNWVQPNHVVKMKEELLDKNGIAIWRFHDYWHSYKPDGIRQGVLMSLGWEKYYNAEKEIAEIPDISLKDLVKAVKSSLGIKEVRVIGNPDQSCKRIALAPGAAGGQRQMAMIERTRPDVFICGEVHEWETAEYIRDSRAFGSETALIILGHSVSEEPGMKWLAEYLHPKLDGINVHHLPSGDPFMWM